MNFSQFGKSFVFVFVFAFNTQLYAQSFAVGNSTGSPAFQDIPGQGFSPSIAGNSGSGIPPSAGPVLLETFSFQFDRTVDSGSLYIFDRPYSGTPADLSSTVVGGSEGLLGLSSSVTGGTWAFGSGLQLPDVTSTYYAYVGSLTNALYAASFTDVYGGTSRGLYAAQPVPGLTASFDFFPTEDAVFSATFNPVAQSFSVTATVATGNGTVSCNPSSVAAGGSSTCTAAPDQGFQVSSWSGDCATAGTSTICELDNIQANQISEVSFAASAPGDVKGIPTLSVWSIGLLGLLLTGVVAFRRRFGPQIR